MIHEETIRMRLGSALAAAGALTLMLAGMVGPTAFAADPVGAELVPDANYRACLAEYAGVADANLLTVVDLNGIEDTVNCYNRGIVSIVGTKYLTRVIGLSLDDNEIGELPAGVFGEHPDLELLSLNSNRITELPEGIFDGLPALQSVEFYENEIARLPAGLFASQPNLRFVDFSNNRITELPTGIFDALIGGTGSLGLNDNRLLDVSGLPLLDHLSLYSQTSSVLVAPGHPVGVTIRNLVGDPPNGPVTGSAGASRWADGQVSWIGSDPAVASDLISFGEDELGEDNRGFELELTVVRGSAVTYDANGGSGTAPTAQIAVPADVVDVQPNPFTRSGYAFAGWNAAADGSGQAYSPGGEFTVGAENAVLYAQWSPIEVAVSGTGIVGQELIGTASGWPETAAVTVQWVVSDDPTGAGYTATGSAFDLVGGAGVDAFTPRSDLIGRYVGIAATAEGDTPVVSLFILVEPLPPGSVSITGSGVAGEPLTAVPAGWPDGTTFTYQWVTSEGAAIPGATGATFVPTDDLVGSRVGVTITPTAADYGQVTVSSEYLTITAATAEPTPTPIPTPTPVPTPTDGSNGSGTGGSLPMTGADAAVAGLLGLVAVFGGSVLLRSRRRS